jgi:SEC-C motif-containing protein
MLVRPVSWFDAPQCAIIFAPMSNKPGRNDPCPCGSGRKYKRCCLPIDQAAGRERARHQARFDDDVSGDPAFDGDDDGGEFPDIEEDAPILDMRAVTRVTGASAVAIIHRNEVSRPPAAVDMSGVLKAHRRQGGTCALCGKAMTRAGAQKHLGGCAPAHDTPNGAEQQLVQVRATAPGLPAYWLDLEVKTDAKLEVLDRFLRQLWLECCGHLSAFRIGAVNYFSRGYDFGIARGFGSFGRRPAERTMNVKLYEALPAIGERFEYEYDFGSTTTLRLELTGERRGWTGRPAARLLARNTPPVWPCAICGQPATLVCAYCLQEEESAFVCATHRRQHGCGEQEGFLPVVNSPRMGVCGYTAQT